MSICMLYNTALSRFFLSSDLQLFFQHKMKKEVGAWRWNHGVKGGLNLGNSCYYSVQNHLSARLLYKFPRSEIRSTIILFLRVRRSGFRGVIYWSCFKSFGVHCRLLFITSSHNARYAKTLEQLKRTMRRNHEGPSHISDTSCENLGHWLYVLFGYEILSATLRDTYRLKNISNTSAKAKSWGQKAGNNRRMEKKLQILRLRNIKP
jgi:hypothetical protein